MRTIFSVSAVHINDNKVVETRVDILNERSERQLVKAAIKPSAVGLGYVSRCVAAL